MDYTRWKNQVAIRISAVLEKPKKQIKEGDDAFFGNF